MVFQIDARRLPLYKKGGIYQWKKHVEQRWSNMDDINVEISNERMVTINGHCRRLLDFIYAVIEIDCRSDCLFKDMLFKTIKYE